ncbi:MAG: hypothetical protein LBN92_06130, partial [Treponema sp.]|nr:hypothetical protein [Treponema sp.]
QEVRKIARELIIVTGNTKFDNAGFIAAGELSIAQTFITNEPVPKPYEEYFRQRHIQVITSAREQDS